MFTFARRAKNIEAVSSSIRRKTRVTTEAARLPRYVQNSKLKDSDSSMPAKQQEKSVPASVSRALKSSGQPLDTGSRNFFEPRFGRSFANVRVVTGEVARASADDLRSHAYSFGNKIVLGSRDHSLSSRANRKLLAHELTHVVQQRHVESEPRGIAPATAPAETQASHAAAQVLGHDTLVPLPVSASSSLVHCQRHGTTPPTTPPPTPARPADPQSRVNDFLTSHGFGIPAVTDPQGTPDESQHAIYDRQRLSLTQIAHRVYQGLRFGTTVTEAAVLGLVATRFHQKLQEAERQRWQWVVGLAWTPQYTFASTAGTGFAHGLQLSGGPTYRLHGVGQRGWELGLGLNLSGFNFTTTGPIFTANIFQNALLTGQLSYVVPFPRWIHDQWINLQWSAFLQVGLGLGNAPIGGTVNLGFLLQPVLGTQLSANLFAVSGVTIQVVVQGAVAYSGLFFAPSGTIHSGAIQGTGGLGVQF